MEMASARENPAGGRPEVILSSTRSDSHTWNLIYIQLFLEEHGYRVTNLGACVPLDMLAEKCAAARPALIVISSVNGHGYLDGADVVRHLRGIPSLRETPMVIGGKLGIASGDPKAAAGLLAAGFDGVFSDAPEDLAAFGAFLRDLPGRSTVDSPCPPVRPGEVLSAVTA